MLDYKDTLESFLSSYKSTASNNTPITSEGITVTATNDKGETVNTATMLSNSRPMIPRFEATPTDDRPSKSERMLDVIHDVAVTSFVQGLVPIPVVGAALGAGVAKLTKPAFVDARNWISKKWNDWN